ncbi:DUF6119 family protein [Nonomuraea sp. C10]|uniref:DUF6119 family protein n=1 Tax=Nonomuraea sp. C10 TaxID=2600577 RepID=UPI0016508681|nr:DUF6119 family protein [Nonomuraea sp. C10]
MAVAGEEFVPLIDLGRADEREQVGADQTQVDSIVRVVAHLPTALLHCRYLCLDRKFNRTRQQTRGKGYEACDGLTDRHTLVHVKAAESSEPLSHQFAQALISTRTLYNEPDARAKFSAKVAELSDGQLTVPENFVPGKVVLAILLKGKELTPDSLYPFAQVALVALADTLRRDHGVIVEVVGIPSGSSDSAGETIRAEG